MSRSFFALVFFIYGLSFFSMGLIVMLEGGRGSDKRLRHALRPLAAFGLIHGIHEWQEMFSVLNLLPGQESVNLLWEGLRLATLAFSFLSLTAFGASLLSPNDHIRRLSLLGPLAQAAIWVIGLLVMRNNYSLDVDLLDVADVWSRYILGMPAAVTASIGLIYQQRIFRKAGMVQFGRDSLWASVAFAWYGILGQAFTRVSPLPPSTFLNQELFLHLFGFPVQVMRAVAAWAAAIFVIRFLRAFEVETQRQIAQLQAARLEEAERREALRGELLRRVVAAQEAERQRIARELHDETGQALTATGMGLRGVTALLNRDKDRAAHNLKQLETLVTKSLTELQHLISDLRPSHLDDLGLPATLRWWADEIESRGSLSVTVTVIGERKPLSPPVRLALFRVTQEALTNVIKHAQAQKAAVILKFNAENVSIEVTDDGAGFDMNRVMAGQSRPSWGLLGMQERAALLGGEMKIDSKPGQGTAVQISIPYLLQNGSEESDDYSIIAGG